MTNLTNQNLPTEDKFKEQIAATIIAHRKLFLFQGIALMILGMLAVAMPLISTLAVESIIGWLFVTGGVIRVIRLLQAKPLPGYWWSLLAAVIAIAVGLMLVSDPLGGAVSLTIILMALFFVEGVFAIMAALNFREHSSNWGWLLFTGLINLVLVVLLWQDWPKTAAWALGLMTGINLLFTGLSLVMLAIAATPGEKN